MKFPENITNGIRVMERTQYMVEWAMFYVQRVITPKVGKPELSFMCSTYPLIVLYICAKFHENISNGIRVIKQTRNY